MPPNNDSSDSEELKGFELKIEKRDIEVRRIGN